MNLKAGLYRHYKGGIYHVLGIGVDSENPDNWYVVYISLDATLPGPRMRIRPIHLWDDTVMCPDGKLRLRFEYIGVEV